MLRDVGIVVGLGSVVLSLGLSGAISPPVAAAASVAVPVVVGIARRRGGGFSHVLRLLATVALPFVGIVVAIEGWDPDSAEWGRFLAAFTTLLLMVFGVYVIFGGLTRRKAWGFLGIIPIIVFLMVQLGTQGVGAEVIVFAILAIVAIRVFAGSRRAIEATHGGSERTAKATIGLATPIVGIVIFALVTARIEAGNPLTDSLGLVSSIVALEVFAYWVARGGLSGAR